LTNIPNNFALIRALKADVRAPFNVELNFISHHDASRFMTQVMHEWPKDEMVPSGRTDLAHNEFELAGIKVKVTS